MKKIVLLIVCFFSFTLFVKAASLENNISLKSCIDGDTALFIINDEEIKVRFLAVNAPELDKNGIGKKASDYTCNILKNAKTIEFEYDEKASKDKYERVLTWVWVDGNLLEELLVKEGYAEVAYIYDDYKYTNSLCLIQSEAINNKKGIWSSGKEEDFCATIDISKVENNIDYNDLDEDIDEDELRETIDKMDQVEKATNAVGNTVAKTSEFLENNGDLVTNVLLYIILGLAGFYILVKELNPKDK